MRECYAAALNAGGRPSGAPSYRNTDCTCFNAAVCDLDGNTIEVIYREGEDGATEQASIGASEHSRVLRWQQGFSKESIDDAQRVGDAENKTQSRGRTVKDLASAVARNTKRSSSAAPATNRNEGASFSGIPINTIVGTALGAAAGAAAIFAMCSTERENAREEAAHLESISGKGSSRGYERQINGQIGGAEWQSERQSSRKAIEAPPVSILKNRRNYSTTDTLPSRPAPRRNYSVTESAFSTQRPLQPSMRTIAPGGYDEGEVQDVLSRYTLARPKPKRAATYDPTEYGPKSSHDPQSSYEPRHREAIEYGPASTNGRGSRHTAKRSTTLPDAVPQLYLEGPRSTASRRDDHRSSYEERDRDLKRHDSGVSMRSHRSRHESDAGRKPSRSETGSKISTAKPSKREKYESAAGVPLPASRAESNASTLKPSKRDKHESAAGVPLPASRAETEYSKRDKYGSAAEVPLPASRARTEHSKRDYPASRAESKASKHPSRRDSAAEIPLPYSRQNSHYSAAPHSRPEPTSRRNSAAQTQLPYSRQNSYHSASAAQYPLPPSTRAASSYVSAAQIPVPASMTGSAWYEEPPEDTRDDSDGMDDMKTVVPDDSISCADFSSRSGGGSSHGRKSGKKASESGRSKHTTSRRGDYKERSREDKSEASTAKPAKSKHSGAVTLPARSRRDEGRENERNRSIFSYT